MLHTVLSHVRTRLQRSGSMHVYVQPSNQGRAACRKAICFLTFHCIVLQVIMNKLPSANDVMAHTMRLVNLIRVCWPFPQHSVRGLLCGGSFELDNYINRHRLFDSVAFLSGSSSGRHSALCIPLDTFVR